MADKITPRAQDYSQWYTDIVTCAKLADYSSVKGCLIIRPRGFALWENIQKVLDRMFKETGHCNAYFPLLIPESFMKKEAQHIEGFSPEQAVVTFAGGEQLKEPLVIRPTSETIIWSTYKKWIQGYRDLPILINQWANVVRWEKRTRPFLRTTEFLWQEGHTAHATAYEAQEETIKMLDIYKNFAEQYMALPVLCGEKTESEKFAGAVKTYSIEAMMQDKKALQAGTSHNLGQNFSKAFDVTFQTKHGTTDYVFATSWGVSTRLIGALIMAHSDDKGLVIPPRLAALEVVIIPILMKNNIHPIVAYARQILDDLKKAGLKVEADLDESASVGWKFAEWEMQGVPIRLEVGPKDKEKDQVVLVRRDTGEKTFVSKEGLADCVKNLLKAIQQNLYDRAQEFRKKNTFCLQDYDDFKVLMKNTGGFVEALWCGEASCEAKVKEETQATIRQLPFDLQNKKTEGPCLRCGLKAKHWVVWAKSY